MFAKEIATRRVLHFGDKAAVGSKKNLVRAKSWRKYAPKGRSNPREALLEAEPGDHKVATVNCNLRS
jgi:hypothetical protein